MFNQGLALWLFKLVSRGLFKLKSWAPSGSLQQERTGVVLTLGHAQVPRPHFARPTPYTVDRGLEAVGQPTAAADHGREGGRGLKAVLACVCVCLRLSGRAGPRSPCAPQSNWLN